jgi:hypothetical protein
MKSFQGIIKGNKIILTKKSDLPKGTKILVFVQPLSEQEAIIKEQLDILKRGFNMGGITYKSREDLYERD